MHAYVKQLLKNFALHEEGNRYFRKPIRRGAASWVIPEVEFLSKRAGYKREHHKLIYNRTSRRHQHLEKNICCYLRFIIAILFSIML
jgi:hypothetical protein